MFYFLNGGNDKKLDQLAFIKRYDKNESFYHVYARCKDNNKYNNRQVKLLDDLIMCYLIPLL